MLIASIINLSFAAIVYLAATIYSLLPDKRGYDVKTYAGKGLHAIGHVGVWIGLCCLIPTVIISVNPDADPTAYLVLMIMGDFFSLWSSMIIFFLKHEFEAIKSDTIYIRRFIKIKEYKLSELSSFAMAPLGIVLIFKDGRRTYIASFTKGLDRFMVLIEERSDEAIPFGLPNPVIKKRMGPKFTAFLIAGATLLVAGICTIGVFSEPYKEEDLVLIQGKVEYVRHFRNGYGIGIEDSLTEYLISTISSKNVTGSLTNEVKAGDFVTMKVENDVRGMSNKYGGRLYTDDVCAFSTETKTFLTYEGYVNAFNINRNYAVAIFIVSSSASVISFVVGGVMAVKDRRKKQQP